MPSKKATCQAKSQTNKIGKKERQRGKENKNQLFKIDGGLLMFLPFFMVGVTYMREFLP